MNQENTFIKYQIQPARVADIPDILALFAEEVAAGRMLPRDKEKMASGIQDWRVALKDDQVIGCVSLVFYNPDLCEVRSLAVDPAHRKNGLGRKLVESALALAKERAAAQVLTLTRASGLFERCGFQIDDIRHFPKKVQTDCQSCPFIDCCDEVALVYTF
jgi:amino-acid N-acetyltransferase